MQIVKQQIVNSQQTSRPIISLNFGHMSACFLNRIKLCSIWCKILVQEKNMYKKAQQTVKFLVQVDLYKFLVQDSWRDAFNF